MNPVASRLKTFLVVARASTAAVRAHASDWPEFRGAGRTGIWNEPGLPTTLPKDGPKVIWKQTLGSGYAGPAVADGKLFILDATKSAGQPDGERLQCFDANDGRALWQVAWPRALKLKGGYDNGPRCTPTVREGKVYALGAKGDLLCVDAKSGGVIWRKDFLKDYDATVPDWGFANAPLVEGKMLVVQVGGRADATVVAFDKDTGRELWRALGDRAGYAPIVAIESGGKRQLIAWTGEAICSLNPTDGKVLWRHPRKLRWDQAISVPTFHAGLNLLLFPTENEGCLALQPGRDETAAKVAWDQPTLACLHTSPVLVGNHVYALHHGTDESECGELRCVEVATGAVKWAEKSVTRLKGFAHATVTRNAATDTWYITNDQGELILAKADAAGYRELARASVTGKTWTHPAYANRRIYTRSETSLVCLSLE